MLRRTIEATPSARLADTASGEEGRQNTTIVVSPHQTREISPVAVVEILPHSMTHCFKDPVREEEKHEQKPAATRGLDELSAAVVRKEGCEGAIEGNAAIAISTRTTTEALQKKTTIESSSEIPRDRGSQGRSRSCCVLVEPDRAPQQSLFSSEAESEPSRSGLKGPRERHTPQRSNTARSSRTPHPHRLGQCADAPFHDGGPPHSLVFPHTFSSAGFGGSLCGVFTPQRPSGTSAVGGGLTSGKAHDATLRGRRSGVHDIFVPSTTWRGCAEAEVTTPVPAVPRRRPSGFPSRFKETNGRSRTSSLASLSRAGSGSALLWRSCSAGVRAIIPVLPHDQSATPQFCTESLTPTPEGSGEGYPLSFLGALPAIVAEEDLFEAPWVARGTALRSRSPSQLLESLRLSEENTNFVSHPNLDHPTRSTTNDTPESVRSVVVGTPPSNPTPSCRPAPLLSPSLVRSPPPNTSWTREEVPFAGGPAAPELTGNSEGLLPPPTSLFFPPPLSGQCLFQNSQCSGCSISTAGGFVLGATPTNSTTALTTCGTNEMGVSLVEEDRVRVGGGGRSSGGTCPLTTGEFTSRTASSPPQSLPLCVHGGAPPPPGDPHDGNTPLVTEWTHQTVLLAPQPLHLPPSLTNHGPCTDKSNSSSLFFKELWRSGVPLDASAFSADSTQGGSEGHSLESPNTVRRVLLQDLEDAAAEVVPEADGDPPRETMQHYHPNTIENPNHHGIGMWQTTLLHHGEVEVQLEEEDTNDGESSLCEMPTSSTNVFSSAVMGPFGKRPPHRQAQPSATVPQPGRGASLANASAAVAPPLEVEHLRRRSSLSSTGLIAPENLSPLSQTSVIPSPNATTKSVHPTQSTATPIGVSPAIPGAPSGVEERWDSSSPLPSYPTVLHGGAQLLYFSARPLSHAGDSPSPTPSHPHPPPPPTSNIHTMPYTTSTASTRSSIRARDPCRIAEAPVHPNQDITAAGTTRTRRVSLQGSTSASCSTESSRRRLPPPRNGTEDGAQKTVAEPQDQADAVVVLYGAEQPASLQTGACGDLTASASPLRNISSARAASTAAVVMPETNPNALPPSWLSMSQEMGRDGGNEHPVHNTHFELKTEPTRRTQEAATVPQTSRTSYSVSFLFRCFDNNNNNIVKNGTDDVADHEDQEVVGLELRPQNGEESPNNDVNETKPQITTSTAGRHEREKMERTAPTLGLSSPHRSPGAGTDLVSDHTSLGTPLPASRPALCETTTTMLHIPAPPPAPPTAPAAEPNPAAVTPDQSPTPCSTARRRRWRVRRVTAAVTPNRQGSSVLLGTQWKEDGRCNGRTLSGHSLQPDAAVPPPSPESLTERGLSPSQALARLPSSPLGLGQQPQRPEDRGGSEGTPPPLEWSRITTTTNDETSTLSMAALAPHRAHRLECGKEVVFAYLKDVELLTADQEGLFLDPVQGEAQDEMKSTPSSTLEEETTRTSGGSPLLVPQVHCSPRVSLEDVVEKSGDGPVRLSSAGVTCSGHNLLCNDVTMESLAPGECDALLSSPPHSTSPCTDTKQRSDGLMGLGKAADVPPITSSTPTTTPPRTRITYGTYATGDFAMRFLRGSTSCPTSLKGSKANRLGWMPLMFGGVPNAERKGESASSSSPTDEGHRACSRATAAGVEEELKDGSPLEEPTGTPSGGGVGKHRNELGLSESASQHQRRTTTTTTSAAPEAVLPDHCRSAASDIHPVFPPSRSPSQHPHTPPLLPCQLRALSTPSLMPPWRSDSGTPLTSPQKGGGKWLVPKVPPRRSRRYVVTPTPEEGMAVSSAPPATTTTTTTSRVREEVEIAEGETSGSALPCAVH